MGDSYGVVEVAVVVPTYNRRDLLLRTLVSVEELDPAPAEIVIVSDGSTDGTDAIVTARGHRLLRTERRGAAAARNAGWRATSSTIVVFLDDDCVVEPGWLAGLLEAFSGSEVGLVQGRTVPAGPVGRFDRTIRVVPDKLLFESCNIAYRRAALDQVGGFDENLANKLSQRMLGSRAARPWGEDTFLGWQVLRAGWQTAYAEAAVARHHVFPGSLADALREDWRTGNFALLVREIPELRRVLPGGRFFLRRHGPLAQLALLGALLALVRRSEGPVLALPYLAWLFTRKHPGSKAEQAVRDAVRSTSLVVGSLRARRIVL